MRHTRPVSWIRRLFAPSSTLQRSAVVRGRRRLSVELLEERDVPAAQLTLDIDIPKLPQPVYLSMYTQELPAGSYVYLQSDHTYAATPKAGTVPSFTSVSANTEAQLSITLPETYVKSARLYFGIGQPVEINTDGAAVPQPHEIASNPDKVFDFVEFTLDDSGDNKASKLTINTSTIDQFGFPILLNVTPTNVDLPDGVGITLDRNQTFADYQAFLSGRDAAENPAAFTSTYQDGFGSTVTTRILSPKNELSTNPVQGVVIVPPPSGVTGTLTPGVYYYGVTAVDAAGKETQVGSQVSRKEVTAADNGVVQFNWGPYPYYTEVSHFNVYRGKWNPDTKQVDWVLAGTATAPPTRVGQGYTDKGSTGDATKKPPFDPLNTYFDGEISQLFKTYESRSITLTATDGTDDKVVYTLQGKTVTFNSADPNAPKAPAGVPDGNRAIEFIVTSAPGTTLVPVGTKFYVFAPFFNTNTYDNSNPAPPQWIAAVQKERVSPSTYVFAGEGTFADNKGQPIPPGVDGVAYSVILGSLENQIVAALTRGIANTVDPSNWASAPKQTPLTLVSGGKLPAGTYYYVVTAVNSAGESTASLEFSAKTDGTQGVQVNWAALLTSTASSFKVYRGVTPGGENQLLATITNDGSVNSFKDMGAVPPAGVTGAPKSGGSLAAGTYYYFISAVTSTGESSPGTEVAVTTSGSNNSVELKWPKVDVSNATSFRIYRGTRAGGENVLIGTVGNTGATNNLFVDTGASAGTKTTPPVYYPSGAPSNLYAAFLHLTSVSRYGLAYGSSYDDQGNYSSTIVTQTSGSSIGARITLGPWAAPPPAVAAVTPSSGSTEGGTSVVISGSNFRGATAVKFGTAAAASFTISADGKTITAVSPAGTAGAVTVTVTTPSGTSATSSATQFTYAAPVAGRGLRSTSLSLPKVMISGPANGLAGQALDFVLSASSPTTQDRAGTYTYLINWGDGSPVQVVPPTANNGSGAQVRHTYVAPGSYTVQVTATDELGRTSAAVVKQVSVRVASAIAFDSLPSSAFVNEPVALKARVTSGNQTMPTGTVQFAVDGVNLGNPVPVVNGWARLDVSTLAPGRHTIGAIYSGSDVLGGSAATAPLAIVYRYQFIQTAGQRRVGTLAALQFQVTDFRRQPTDPTAVTSLTISPLTATGATLPPVVQVSGAALTFNAQKGIFTFNWNTVGLAPGRYQLKVTLADGTERLETLSLLN